MKKFVFYPISSGSCGNAIYVECAGVHFLIDCGLSGIRIKRGLAMEGFDVSNLSFILLTHAHFDHTSGIGVMARRHHIPIYASTGTWNYIRRDERLGKIDSDLRCPFRRDPKISCLPPGMTITAFSTPHDAADSVGYRIECDGRSAAIATDLGYVSLEVKSALLGADLVLIESNYDPDMLWNSSYPLDLIERIEGNRGHLSNAAAGKFAVELVKSGTKKIYLGHLSQENNTPRLARSTVADELKRAGIDPQKDVRLMLAKRDEPSVVSRW